MDFRTKIETIIIGIFVSFFLIDAFKIIFEILLAPRFGYKCKHIIFFGIQFEKENGKWTCKKEKFSPTIQRDITVDLSKHVSNDIDKKGKQLTWITYLLQTIVSLVIIALFFDEMKGAFCGEDMSIFKFFFGSIALGVIVKQIIDLCINIYLHEIILRRLGGYVDDKIKKMRRGYLLTELDLKPLDQLHYKNPSGMEKMMYYRIYVSYLILIDDIEGLKTPFYEMTEYYFRRDFVLQDVLSYYWLIFYYSHYNLSPTMADMFFARVSGTLLNDNDANAKRVLAYYYYGIKNDIEQAKHYIKEGLAVVDEFSLPGSERELERKLLKDLESVIIE